MKENLKRFILFLLLVGCAYHQLLTRFLTNRKLRFFLLAGIFLINTQSVSAQCFSNPPDNVSTTVFYTCSGSLSFRLSSNSGDMAPEGPAYGSCNDAGQRLGNAQWLIVKATDNGQIQLTSNLSTGGINIWVWGGFDSMPSDCSELTNLNICGQYDHNDPINPFTVIKDKYYVVLLSGMLGSAPDFTITGTGPANIPPPTVISQSRCGSGTVTLTASGALTGEKYNWYDSDGNLLQSSTNAQFITPELSATTQYTVRTSVTTNTSTSCESDPTTVTVTINNLPSVTVQPVSTSICHGSNLTLSVTATGSTDLTYQWRKDGVNITGATSASHTINNAISTDAGSYDVVISNSCGSATSDAAVITVNPIPTVTVPANLNVCPGASVPGSTFTSSPPGATYSWTNSNTAIGLSASGIGNVPEFTATNSTTSSITSTITVTPTLNGCTGNPVNYTITVKPRVTVAVSDIIVCSGTIVPSSSFISAPLGATFNWTNSNTNIGLAETSGTGNVHSFTATNSTASPIISTITVTPTVNGCAGTPVTYTITVNPLPVITAIPTPTSSCAENNGKILISATVSGPFKYSIDGGNSFPSNTGVFEELSAGSYIPAVRNSAGCITLGETVSISSPGAPAAPTVTPGSDTVCEGEDVTFAISPPITDATYTWTGPMGFTRTGTDPFLTITGITTSDAGEYAVTATVTGCVSAASTFDIFVNPLPVATVPSNMVVCSGTMIPATSFTSTPDGATYSWTNNKPEIGLDASGIGNVHTFIANATLEPITATITVTPTLNDCVGQAVNYTITVNPLPTATISNDATICYGASTNLSVALTGSPPYTLTYTDQSTSVTVPDIWTTPYIIPVSPTSTKTYTITNVSDANSCSNTGSGSAVVTVPLAPLSATVSKTNVTCFGSATGSISYTISGGTSPYTITYTYNSGSASAPLTIPASGSLSNLLAGTYQVTLTDANNCTPIVQTIVITQPTAALAGTAASTNVSCRGENDGTITISPSGGYGSYEYSINEGTSWQASNTFTGLAPQTYHVMVRDAAQISCVVTINTSLTITEPLSITGTATPTHVTCFSLADGTITVNASGGYGTYQYSINGGLNWQSSNTFTGLTPQTYTIHIRDTLHPACTGVINNITIIQPAAAISGTASSTNVTCLGTGNGSITIAASGGYGTYQYSIDGGATWQADNSFTGLAPDSYSVIVRDASQITCMYTIGPVTIIQPTLAVTAKATSTNVTCFGQDNGTIIINATGGYGDYEYSKDGGTTWQTENSFTGLAPDSYSVMVRDASQITCTYIIDPLTIVQPTAAISATATSTNVTCFGLGNGSISVTPSGGYGSYQYSIDGGTTWQAENSFTGLLPNSYSIIVRDASQIACIYTIEPLTIIQPPAAVTATATSTDVTCFGLNNGSISAMPSGGYGTYQYSIDGGATWQADNSFTGLAPDSYSIIVRDASQITCMYTVGPVTIMQPTLAVTATATSTNVTCFGQDNGTIIINATGGYGDYEYSKDGGITWQTGNTFSNLPPGNYNVLLRDADQTSCTYIVNASLAIIQPATEVSGTATSTNITCYGLTDGTITINASGGYGNYEYSINGGLNWQTTNVFTDLAPASYNVQVRDAAATSCVTIINTSLTIVQPAAAVSGTSISTNVTCFGVGDGTISITATGGYGTYEYSINGGTTWQTGNTFTNLGPDSYHILVRDLAQIACVATVNPSLNIVQPVSAVSGTATSTNVTCFGLNNGTITISASGGYGNYEYTINGGTAWQTGNIFSNLAPGNYNVQVRDADQTSCSFIVNDSLAIIQSTGPVAGTAVSTNITCTGAGDGSITISASGGYGTYEYSINGGLNWQTANSFTGLSAGSYNIMVRDLAQPACTGSVNPVTITEPAALTLDGSHSPILCYGGSTTVTLIANGGTGALEYRLGTGSYQASNIFTGILAGSHQFWVRDINGCEQDYTITISQPAQLTLTATASPIQCDGTSTVTLLAQGGTGNYQFRNGSNAYQVSNTFNLGQGSYTFYVTDGACEESVVVNIAGLSTLTLTGSFTPVTCFGGNSTVTLTANGGNGSYSYKADNGTWQTGNTFTVPSGDHIFTVRDAGGCQQFFQVNIPDTEQLNIVLVKLKDASCFGTSTGSLSLNMTGNKGSVTITWLKDGQPISAPQDLNALSAGSYSVRVTDACSSMTSNEVIIQPSPLAVLLRKIKDADCTGTATGALDLQISGGEGTVIQTWTKDGAVIPTPSNLSALTAGTYRVTVQDNCSTVQSENIIIDPATLQIDFYKITDVSCNGSTDGGIGMRIFNSTGATTVSWFKDNAPVSTPVDLRQLPAGTYHVQVADFCSQVTSAKISITEPEVLAAGTLSKKNVSCFGGTDGSATLTITGGTAPYRYLWSNNSTNKDLTGVSTGTYTVTVTDLNNCSATQSVTITEPTDLTLHGSHSPILCYGGSTTVTLIANGGTGALEYRLGTGSYQASNIFTGVLAGSHQFWVRDINGCEQDYTITISQPAQLTLTATASSIQCDGTSTVTLVAEGGTGNYQFRNGSNAYQVSNTFNLGQGSYTFYVTDGACEESVVVNIAGQSSLTLTGSFTPITCFGGNSTVTLSANGGNGSYSYKADNGAWQTGNTFTLPSGDHFFTVRDAGGCQQFFQVNIPETEQLNVILTKLKDASCFGTSTGSLSLNMTGNKGSVTITWLKDGQPISTPIDLNALPAGSYSVRVTDGCSSMTSNEVIIQPSPLAVLLRKIKDADCTGTATGVLDLQISGGEGTVTQTWTKDGTVIPTPSNLSALTAGTYRVTVQDNCSTVQSENIIIDPAALQIDFYKITDVSCKGNTDGGIGMRIFNSTGTTTVSWFKDNTPVITPVNLRQLPAGTYHVQVADFCSQVTTQQITITEPEALAVGTLIVKYTVCKTSNDGVITANITGGTKPYRFQWKGLSQTSSVINNLSPGLYELLVTDAEGCTVTASAEVMAGNCPPIAIDDRFTTDEEVAISGSVAINDFDRQNESLTFSMTSAVKNGRIIFTGDGKFTYTPNPGFWATETFTYQVCNTSGLCTEATAYISVIPYTVVSLTPAILNVREGKKTAITAKLMRPFKDDVIITISYSGNAIKEKDYVLLDQFQQIRIPKGQVTTTEKITLAALTDDLQEGDENVILQISETSDPLVRIGTGSVVIISDIYPSDSLPATPVSKEIPANPDITPDPLVSPNNDGQGNEFFKIENIVSFPDNEVIIFNRWGNEIFRVRGYNESDRVFSGIANKGLATNTNSPLPDGVYYYLITTKRMVNGQSIVALNKGYLILKR